MSLKLLQSLELILLVLVAMLFCSGMLLLYSAIIVPFQICIWDYNDPCNIFPTLFFDLGVDTFFLVNAKQLNTSNSADHWEQFRSILHISDIIGSPSLGISA